MSVQPNDQIAEEKMVVVSDCSCSGGSERNINIVDSFFKNYMAIKIHKSSSTFAIPDSTNENDSRLDPMKQISILLDEEITSIQARSVLPPLHGDTKVEKVIDSASMSLLENRSIDDSVQYSLACSKPTTANISCSAKLPLTSCDIDIAQKHQDSDKKMQFSKFKSKDFENIYGDKFGKELMLSNSARNSPAGVKMIGVSIGQDSLDQIMGNKNADSKLEDDELTSCHANKIIGWDVSQVDKNVDSSMNGFEAGSFPGHDDIQLACVDESSGRLRKKKKHRQHHKHSKSEKRLCIADKDGDSLSEKEVSQTKKKLKKCSISRSSPSSAQKHQNPDNKMQFSQFKSNDFENINDDKFGEELTLSNSARNSPAGVKMIGVSIGQDSLEQIMGNKNADSKLDDGELTSCHTNKIIGWDVSQVDKNVNSSMNGFEAGSFPGHDDIQLTCVDESSGRLRKKKKHKQHHKHSKSEKRLCVADKDGDSLSEKEVSQAKKKLKKCSISRSSPSSAQKHQNPDNKMQFSQFKSNDFENINGDKFGEELTLSNSARNSPAGVKMIGVSIGQDSLEQIMGNKNADSKLDDGELTSCHTNKIIGWDVSQVDKNVNSSMNGFEAGSFPGHDDIQLTCVDESSGRLRKKKKHKQHHKHSKSEKRLCVADKDGDSLSEKEVSQAKKKLKKCSISRSSPSRDVEKLRTHRSRRHTYYRDSHYSSRDDQSRRRTRAKHYHRHYDDHDDDDRLPIKVDKEKLRRIAISVAGALSKLDTVQTSSVASTTAVKDVRKTVAELTEFCKRISEKEVAGESDSSNVVSNGMNSDREEVHLHHPFLVKNASGLPGGIVMNIRNSKQLPILSAQEKRTHNALLHSQFPVSSGTYHRCSESAWVPVVPTSTTVLAVGSSKSKPTASRTPASVLPSSTATVGIFPDGSHLAGGGGDTVMTAGVSQNNQAGGACGPPVYLPGQFTGLVDAHVLTPAQLAGPSKHHQAWTRKAVVNGEEYQPSVACCNKKLAKAEAAVICLQRFGLLPADYLTTQ